MGMELGTASFLGNLIGGIFGIGTSALNYKAQQEANAANLQAVRETNQQNMALTEKAWQRDDSQLQRARADAQAAGFSPLAALSNNLTNTAPATMQAPQVSAPQFDSTSIVNSIHHGVDSYISAKATKAQVAYINEQKEAQKLENKFNRATLYQRQLQNTANLAKTMKELDGMNLSNYEKASILVANGIPASTVQKLIPHTTKETVVKNEGQKYINQLQDAQAKLATENTTMSEKERNYWYKTLDTDDGKIWVPVYDTNKKIWMIKGIGSKGKNRKEMADIYEKYMNSFINSMATYDYNYQLSDQKLLNEIMEKNSTFVLELLKMAKP